MLTVSTFLITGGIDILIGLIHALTGEDNKKASLAGEATRLFDYLTIFATDRLSCDLFASLPDHDTNLPGCLPFVFSYSCHSFSSRCHFRNLLLHFTINCVKHFSFEDIQRPFHSVTRFLLADTGEVNQR